MSQINIYQAKTQLSKLLRRVQAGEEVVIARSGKPIARLVPLEERSGKRRFGQDRGLYTVPEDFDESLPEDVLKDFGL